jgi:Ca2+-binding EF-hand superfamily protein
VKSLVIQRLYNVFDVVRLSELFLHTFLADLSRHLFNVGPLQHHTPHCTQSFVQNADNCIQVEELCSGISVLCGGTPEEKIQAIFSVFDADKSGKMNREEVVTYLAAVFKVCPCAPGSCLHFPFPA